jgi:hypothetical protein
VTTTLQSLMDEVQINLSGYTYQQDRSTYLVSAVTTTVSPSTSPLVLQLASSNDLGKGIVEIDEELLWVDNVDRVANTATVSPYGRGYLGTTASTHAVDTKVTVSPIFPKYSIKKAINDTIEAVGGSVFAVKQTTFTYNAAITTYDFDGLNIENILTVSWQDIGPSKEWIRIKRWDFDPFADVTTWGSNSQTLTIGDVVIAGRTVKVMYATQPTIFDVSSTTNSEVFTTTTGLPSSTKDVVVLGACYRLLQYLDPARAAQYSPQADEIDAKRPFGASNTAVRQLFSLYTQRLNEERAKQQSQYPPRVHYSAR